MEVNIMKTSKKAILAATALGMMGVGSIAAANTITAAKENTVATVTEKNDDVENHTLHINNNNVMFKGPATPGAKDAKEGFDVAGLFLDGLKIGGANFIGYLASTLGKDGLNSALTALGFDMRSTEEKKLDEICQQLKDIQQNLSKGFSDVKRKIVELHNKDIMNDLLGKLGTIQTPVISKMSVLADLAKKEQDSTVNKTELDNQKKEFYKGLSELKFPTLSSNNLWNATEQLANSFLVPYSVDRSIKLFDLYEESYGTAETWDYMTVQPRKKFITYVGFLVNSLCQLAQLSASSQMSQLKKDDSNLLGYEQGVRSMIKAVNTLNGQFKDELVKLDAIQKKHDVDHLITYRDRNVDKEGNIVIQDGVTLSTSLLPVTPGDNDFNYISYQRDGNNPAYVQKDAMGSQTALYENVIYTLDCTSQEDLYKKVFSDYSNYIKAVCVDTKSFSMKDYLVTAGFTCKNKDLFDKAKGFYKEVKDSEFRASDDGIWTRDVHDELRVYYYDFKNVNADGKSYDVYDDVKEYRSHPFASTEYSKPNRDAINDYYLCFVNQDQKTIYGKLKKTVIERVTSNTAKGTKYEKHFKGHRKSDGKNLDKVEIQDGQI